MSNNIDQNDAHVSTGLDLLLAQFANASNLQALLTTYLQRIQDLEDDAYLIIDARDLDTATGDRLDGIGQIVGQQRNGQDDDTYRTYLRARILINKSCGTMNELIVIVRALEGDNTATVETHEFPPKTLELRLGNSALTIPELYYELLELARSAATKLYLIYTPAEDDDNNIFTLSSTSSVETSGTQGCGDWELGEDYGTGGKLVAVYPADADPPEPEGPDYYVGLEF